MEKWMKRSMPLKSNGAVLELELEISEEKPASTARNIHLRAQTAVA